MPDNTVVKKMIKIEFEGTDGAGKTTGLKYFLEQAQRRALKTVETREVGNPHIPACVKLRELVLNPDSKLSGAAMELIFSAMRMENDRWLRELDSRLDRPNMVVSDRGWFSHLAYTDHNVSERFTEQLYNGLMGYLTTPPDVVIYFTVDTEVALKRRISRGAAVDVIEAKGIEYQNLVRDSFAKHLREYENIPNLHIFIVDANRDLDNVKAQLDGILASIANIYRL
jgi:dTMP kinase